MNLRISDLKTCVSAILVSLALLNFAKTNLRADEPHHRHGHHHRCCRCGCECVPVKICRPVEETKKVAKTVFDCESEDFCVPGRSNLCGVEKGCDECGNVTCKRIWEPTCAQVRSKCVLKKSTVEEEVKVIKWVVEEVCDACAGQYENIQQPAPGAVPTPTPVPGAYLPNSNDDQVVSSNVELQPITSDEVRMALLPNFAPSENIEQPSTLEPSQIK